MQLQEQQGTSQPISTAAGRQRQTKMQEVIMPSNNRATKLSKQLVIWAGTKRGAFMTDKQPKPNNTMVAVVDISEES